MGDSNKCRDFERGECTRGAKCRYEHPADSDIPQHNPRGSDGGGRRDSRDRAPRGGDRGGDSRGRDRNDAHGNGPRNAVCKDFLNNRCDRGDGCRFRHVSQREMDLEMQINDMQMHANMRGRPPMMMPPNGGGEMHGKRRRGDEGMGGMGAGDDVLQRKIGDLQKQVTELRQMNDELYEQNKRYREQLKAAQAGSTAYPGMASGDAQQQRRF